MSRRWCVNRVNCLLQRKVVGIDINVTFCGCRWLWKSQVPSPLQRGGGLFLVRLALLDPCPQQPATSNEEAVSFTSACCERWKHRSSLRNASNTASIQIYPQFTEVKQTGSLIRKGNSFIPQLELSAPKSLFGSKRAKYCPACLLLKYISGTSVPNVAPV